MGIVKALLADFTTTNGQEYRIEYNENNMIHIHTEQVRIDLTKEEFFRVANAITEGRDELVEIKDDL